MADVYMHSRGGGCGGAQCSNEREQSHMSLKQRTFERACKRVPMQYSVSSKRYREN